MFQERKKYSKLEEEAAARGDKEDRLRNKNKQTSVKKVLNSFYGVSASKYFRFYDRNIAEAVTLTGQKIIKHALAKVQEMGYKVITGDTDSVLFTAGNDCDVERAKEIGKKVGESIDESLTPFCKENFNIDSQNFHFKQEMIADAGIFIAKKHYIMHLVNNKGVDLDEMEYKGIDLVRNDTPKVIKEWLKKIYEAFVRGVPMDEVKIMIGNYKDYIINAPYQDIMIPTSLSKDLSGYVKTTPIHVKGARYWETNYAEKYGVSFQDTDRGKYIWVKVTDPEMPPAEVLTIPDGVDRFPFTGMTIDYDKVLERLYVKKLEDLWFVIRVEELRTLISQGKQEKDVLEYIWKRMNDENPGMFQLKKIKYNVIVRHYSKIWWDQFQDILKIDLTQDVKKKYIEFVQKKLDLM
jgi:DNA polymerase elongation subunit (family B)